MTQLEIDDKENISYIINKNIKQELLFKKNSSNLYFQNLLSQLKISSTISSKKIIIDNLITTITKNKEIVNVKEAKEFLINIYKLLQSSISENNILFILSQLSLIELFINILYKDKTFKLFFKRILPKLIDKFYLHNESIDEKLLIIFEKSIENLLTIDDYYVYIENITLEDDNNYIFNILHFFHSYLKNNDNKNKNKNYETVPLNVINAIKQKYDEYKNINDNNYNIDSNDNQLYEICEKILLIIDENKVKNKNCDKSYSKSLIKKIVKSIKENDSSSSLRGNDSFLNDKENNKSFTKNSSKNDIFQILKTNNNDFREKNKLDINLNNEIIYLEGNNSLILSQNKDKNKMNHSKLQIFKNNYEKKSTNKYDDNNYFSSSILSNFGVSTIDPPQGTEEDNQNLFTLSNQNTDNMNDEIFQKTPVFHFDGSGTLIKKNILNNNKDYDEIRPVNLHEQFNDRKTLEKNINYLKEEKIKNKEHYERYEIVKNMLGKEIINLINNAKWEIKKQGYKLLYDLIKVNDKNKFSKKENIKDLIYYMEENLNIFKETNFNIIIEIIKLFNYLIMKNLLNKQDIIDIILIYYDKMPDIKLNKCIIDLIDSSFDKIEANIILKQLIMKLMATNNIKLLNEYSNYFIHIINDNNITNISEVDIIDYCKYMIKNQNSKVRKSGINLLCKIYKYIGNDIKFYLKDLQETTFNKICDEFKKIKIIKNNNIIKNKFVNSKIRNNSHDMKNRNITNGVINRKFSSGNLKGLKEKSSSMPIDISKKIDNKLLNFISNGKWMEKKSACDEIIKILNDTNMNILPNGLNDLFSVINNKLNDSNKNLIRLLINLISKLIESLKQNFKFFLNDLAFNLIYNLSDKNEKIRKEIQICFEKIVYFIGLDSLIIYFPSFLKNENYEMRFEILTCILKHNNKVSESTGRIIFKEMIDNLLLCLQDKNVIIRNKAEEVISLSLKYISIDNYYKVLNNYKPVNGKDLTKILNKIKNKKQSIRVNYLSDNNSNDKNYKNNKLSNNNKNISKILSTSQNEDINFSISNNTSFISYDDYYKINNNKKNLITNIKKSQNLYKKYKTNRLINSRLLNDISRINNSSSFRSLSITNSFSSQNSNTKIKNRNTLKQIINNNEKIFFDGLKNNKNSIRKTITSRNSKKNMLSNNTKTIFTNNKLNQTKAQRYIMDKKNNFNMFKIKKEEYNKIKELSKNLFSKSFFRKIFSNNFENEITAYKIMINQLKQKKELNKYFDNLDIILKVIGYKAISTMNMVAFKIILEYLEYLFNLINEYNHKLNEIEYNIIFCILIEKFYINNNILKEKIINLINKYINLIGSNKIIPLIMNIGIHQDNKIKKQILEIIKNLYISQNLNISSHIFINLLQKLFTSSKDNIIRAKCFFLFKEIYAIYGNDLWNYITIEDKIKKIIEEKNNNDNLIEADTLDNQIKRNKSYKDKNILQKYKTNYNHQNNSLIKNENSKIFYKTSINFNSNFKEQKEVNINYTNEKKPKNKIKVKKQRISKTPIKNILLDFKAKENMKIEDSNNNISLSLNSNDSSFFNNNISNDNNDMINKKKILTKEDLIIKMNNLLSDNYLIKINSIIILHEILCLKYEENKFLILNNIEQIMDIFAKIIKELYYYFRNDNKQFESDLNIIKYAKYIVTTICKLLSNIEILNIISYKTIYTLSEEIINFLLINEDNLKDENNCEKNIIFKSLNSSMMRILENYNITSILLILIELIINYYNKNTEKNNLFILTVLNCLEKKIQNIEEIIIFIEIDAILLQIHLLLNKLEQNIPELKAKDEMDKMIIIFIKKFLFELVNYKKEKIFEDYNRSVKCHFLSDKYILKWINEFINVNSNIHDDKIDKGKKNNNNLNNTKIIYKKSLTNISSIKYNKKDINKLTYISNKNVRKYK